MTKKKHPTTRFEVSLQDRLKQRTEANNAVRMPRLGFKQYRVYDIKPKSEYEASALTMQSVFRATRVKMLPGGTSLNVISSGRNTGKSKFIMNQLYGYVATQWIVDDSYLKLEEPSRVQWLKPKHVTMLKLKGHRVEEL